MRQCPVDKIKPDMIVARPIYDGRYRKLLAAGAKLTPEAIRRIRMEDYPHILIKETGTEEIKVDELIGVRVRQEVTGALEAFAAYQHRDMDAKSVREMMKERKEGQLNANEVQRMVEVAVENLLKELMYHRRPVYYPGVYPSKNQLIHHSTNVAILALLIGWRFRMSKQELLWLGKSALLHDIGKLRLDPKLNEVHPKDYSEELLISYSMHPQMSTVLLDQDININTHITMGVMQHHEKQDGTGFPEKLPGSNLPPTSKLRPRGSIHRFAEIISAANYFDNLVSGRVEYEQMTPPEAVKKLIEATPKWFNEHITNEALEVINVYPVGSLVRVSDATQVGMVGLRGVVAKMNPMNLHRPVITLLYGLRQRLEQPITVDLSKDTRVRIEYILDLTE